MFLNLQGNTLSYFFKFLAYITYKRNMRHHYQAKEILICKFITRNYIKVSFIDGLPIIYLFKINKASSLHFLCISPPI